jgi:hypothetical protein
MYTTLKFVSTIFRKSRIQRVSNASNKDDSSPVFAFNEPPPPRVLNVSHKHVISLFYAVCV